MRNTPESLTNEYIRLGLLPDANRPREATERALGELLTPAGTLPLEELTDEMLLRHLCYLVSTGRLLGFQAGKILRDRFSASQRYGEQAEVLSALLTQGARVRDWSPLESLLSWFRLCADPVVQTKQELPAETKAWLESLLGEQGSWLK